jgi:hypothetical protein
VTDERSLGSSLEHLLSGSRGVVARRTELALLDAGELVSRTMQEAALVGLGVILAAAAWLAGAGGVVLSVSPDASAAMRLGVFGAFNAAGAALLVALAVRRGRPASRVVDGGDVARSGVRS